MSFTTRASLTACGALLVGAVVAAPLAHAFTVPLHRTLTIEGLRALEVDRDDGPVGFSERAYKAIAAANEAVDRGTSAIDSDPAAHFSNGLLAQGGQRLLDDRQGILELLRESPPAGGAARTRLGEALHTLQDFYAHTNWVDQGNMSIDSRLGASALPAPTGGPGCQDDPSVLSIDAALTSGFFPPDSSTCSVVGGRCAHGDFTAECPGISKDEELPDELHVRARALAQDATTRFVRDILDALGGDAAALDALFDVGGGAGFVIDDTGSMQDEIEGVKVVVGEIIEAVGEDGGSNTWVLERFGDPDIGPAATFATPEELLEAVNALRASGGGDCPERSQAALLEAIDAVPSGAQLFFFSDASAKDPELTSAVVSRAREKSIQIVYVLTGSCGSGADPSYVRGAAETGGQLFTVANGETDGLFPLVQPAIGGSEVTIASAGGSFSGAATLDVPVDSTVDRLILSVSASQKDEITVQMPSGAALDLDDPDAATVSDLSTGCIVSVPAPDPGTWNLQATGGGTFSMLAQGTSPIALERFEFVQPSADVHGGFIPLPGLPIAGEPAMVQADINGEVMGGAVFRLMGRDGEPLGLLDLEQGGGGSAADVFYGLVDLPDVPFRVVLEGTGPNGFGFSRQFPSLFRTQSIFVELVPPSSNRVPIGRRSQIQFRVTNRGAPGEIGVQATDGSGFVTGVVPARLELGRGEGAIVTVEIQPPAELDGPVGFAVILTATRLNDQESFNFASVDLEASLRNRFRPRKPRGPSVSVRR